MDNRANPVLMTQAQYGAHQGVSRQYISNLAKGGILVMRPRLVDVQASDAVLDDTRTRHQTRHN